MCVWFIKILPFLSSYHEIATAAPPYFGRIRTRLGVIQFPRFSVVAWSLVQIICFLLLFHPAKMSIVKRLFQGCYNVTRARVERRPCDHGRRYNGALNHSASLAAWAWIGEVVILLQLVRDIVFIMFSASGLEFLLYEFFFCCVQRKTTSMRWSIG